MGDRPGADQLGQTTEGKEIEGAPEAEEVPTETAEIEQTVERTDR